MEFDRPRNYNGRKQLINLQLPLMVFFFSNNVTQFVINFELKLDLDKSMRFEIT